MPLLDFSPLFFLMPNPKPPTQPQPMPKSPNDPSGVWGAAVHWSAQHWAHISAREFELARCSGLADRTLALIPLGALEQHGPHLPLNTDAAIAQAITAAALQRLPQHTPVLALPTLELGLSIEHQDFAGTLTLSPTTQLHMLQDIAQGIERTGVRRVLLFNAHGGNAASIDIAARHMRMQQRLTAWHCSWGNLPLPTAVQQMFDADEWRFGIHGGEVETSLMLHIAPHLVQMQHAANFDSSARLRAQCCPIAGNGRSAKLGWAMQDYNPRGATGHAARADAQRGAALLQAAAQALADLMQEILAWPAQDNQSNILDE